MTAIAFDSSGKVKHSSAEELAVADQNTAIVSYVYGTMDDGRPYWAYVAIKPSMYREFHAITASTKAMVIGDYGTVIAAGFESEPPPEVVEEMHEVYGFDEQYEEQLRQEALKQQDVLFEKNETSRINDIVAMMLKKSQNNT